MSIITFWSNGKEETAKTFSMAAAATVMAIEHNYKILMISTIRNDDSLERCYWEPKEEKAINQFVGDKKDIASGIDGLVSLALSNKLTPESISNYTRLIFPGNRLEFLSGSIEKDEEKYKKIREAYKDVIQVANKFYDYVFVDLNKGFTKDYVKEILKISDIIVVNIAQRLKMINDLKLLKYGNDILKKENTMFLIGRYDKFSKYNAKNIARTLGYKDKIFVIPYNTLFFEACNEGKVADFFLRFRKLSPTDRNATFIQEIKNTSEKIIAKADELKMMYFNY